MYNAARVDYDLEWDGLMTNGESDGDDGFYTFWDILEHMGNGRLGSKLDNASKDLMEALQECCSGVINPEYALLLVQRIQRNVEVGFDNFHNAEEDDE